MSSIQQQRADLSNEKRFVVHVKEHMPLDPIFEQIEKARDQVRILDAWISRPHDIERALIRSHPSAGVQVLLLDAYSKEGKMLMEQRFADLGWDVDLHMRGCIDTFERLKSLNNVEVRRFAALPPFNLYWVDHMMHIGMFWHTQISSVGPFLSGITEESPLYTAAAQTFDKLWKKWEWSATSDPRVSGARSDGV